MVEVFGEIRFIIFRHAIDVSNRTSGLDMDLTPPVAIQCDFPTTAMKVPIKHLILISKFIFGIMSSKIQLFKSVFYHAFEFGSCPS